MWKTWKTPHLTGKNNMFKTAWKLVVKLCEKLDLSTTFCVNKFFPLFCPQILRKLFSRLFHRFSTLSINFLLNFLNLVTEIKSKLYVSFDLFDTMHNSSVIFYAHFARNFRSTHIEFLG